jgi:eukaryotic translation initiation factor 2C
MYYPPASARHEQNTSSSGEEWSLPRDMNDRTALIKYFAPNPSKQAASVKLEATPQWPIREAFINDNGKGKVLTNHFVYSLSVKKLYEYKILDLPEGVSRRKVKNILEKAVQTWPFLQQNQNSFATNNLDTIVSWKPLHEEIDTDPLPVPVSIDEYEHSDYADSSEYDRPTWSGPNITSGRDNVLLRFQFVHELDVQDLTQYSLADPLYERTNFDKIASCLNILISKSLGKDVHKQSANKFFVKTARRPLGTSSPLETIRGYFYSVKPGMGNIIVNFNIATSAFFCPILVSEFLQDRATFSPDKTASLLKRLRVLIEFDRVYESKEKMLKLNSEVSRMKTIFGLSTEGIGQLTFRNKKRGPDGRPLKDADNKLIFEGPEFNVLEHLKTGKL